MEILRDLPMRFLAMLVVLLSSPCLGSVVIPIEIEDGNPIASARINGVPVKLVIDSGGGVVVLKPDVARRVGAVRAESTRTSIDAHGMIVAQPVLTLNTLELGGHEFSRVEAAEYSGEVPRDGSVGREFLNRYLVIYDYPSRKITLFTPDEGVASTQECRGASARTIPHPEGVIVSMVATDAGTMKVMWDTGATNSFVKKTFVDQHKLAVQPPFYTSQRFAFGQPDFGPLRFVVLDFSEPPDVDGYVGHNFFAGHVVCIDHRGQKIRVRKSERKPGHANG
jgi:hypothetical protein